mmetsp:Transcript_30925/g.58733  ORF Transcript_30925/g.58733 Transcript_30925/m.58733 type:complete len:119 (-) Transcript_30925:388-744(-)
MRVAVLETCRVSLYFAGCVKMFPLFPPSLRVLPWRVAHSPLLNISSYRSKSVCIAKTQYSFSCDAKAKGVPTGFRIFVREIRSCVGAGFLYPICKCNYSLALVCVQSLVHLSYTRNIT